VKISATPKDNQMELGACDTIAYTQHEEIMMALYHEE